MIADLVVGQLVYLRDPTPGAPPSVIAATVRSTGHYVHVERADSAGHWIVVEREKLYSDAEAAWGPLLADLDDAVVAAMARLAEAQARYESRAHDSP